MSIFVKLPCAAVRTSPAPQIRRFLLVPPSRLDIANTWSRIRGGSVRSALLIALLHALPGTAPLVAQSITSASVSGTVRSTDFSPVGQARVSLSPIGSGSAYDATTTAAGSFAVALVQPGSYEIRVEVFGYRPLVARVLTVGGGEDRTVSLTLTPEPPPVSRVDTVSLGGASSTRWRAGSVQLGGTEIEILPHRFDDLASVASLATSFDEALGAQGLPGDMTLIVADGVPFYRAPHPTARQELLPDALFPRSAVSAVTTVHNASDVELAGSAGAYVNAATRASTNSGGIEFDGSYSGKPTWSSSELDIEAPSLLSWQGGARGGVEISPSARLVLSGEALSQQTPLAPRASETLAGELAGLDADLLGSLTAPGVEQYDRYSGLLRLDVQQSRTSRLFFRGAGGFSRRDFQGAGPVSIAGPAALAQESMDFSTAFGVVSRYSRSTSIEFRAGFSGSYRDFGPSVADVPPAYLTGSGASLGDLPSAAGESNRTDFVVIPVIRWSPDREGRTTFKFGATIRASSHSMRHSPASLGDFQYSDPAALLGGVGFGQATVAPKAEFGTQEYGAFVQYDSRLSPGLRLLLGGRYDYEMIGGDGVPLNQAWFAATGLSNSDFQDGYHQFGLRGSLTWDPVVDGATRVVLTGSMHEGDVDIRAISSFYADATSATSTRFAGSGIGWPQGGIPPLAAPALTSLTLVGPDMRAPRTTHFEVAVLQRLGEASSLFLRGSTRRTDYLTRRRNLNLPLVPQALDPDGRRIMGTLAQEGSLITSTSEDARRFTDFAEAWALDPDGWSEYIGLTAGVEHTSARVDLHASYTYSETTDNWVGARSGAIGSAVPPGLPRAAGETEWAEGVSDFDAAHRAAAGFSARIGPAEVSGVYRFRSGLPFTPGYRLGVDANGDGSSRNDVAFVPDAAQLGSLADSWSCLSEHAGAFAVRNSCRGSSVHSVNARLRLTFARFSGRGVSLTIDGLNLVESSGGVADGALLLVDPTGSITTSPDGSTVTIPTTINAGFGEVLYPSSRGRMLRIGVRIGG